MSFSDREIMQRYLGDEGWTLNESLRNQRRTSRSARMLFEILGDMWVIERNPFIQEDLLNNQQCRNALIEALHHRLAQFEERINQNDKATRSLDPNPIKLRNNSHLFKREVGAAQRRW